MTDEKHEKSLGIVRIIKSVLSAFLGVQKKEIADEDFSAGRAFQFITIGIILTIVFVLILVAVVQRVASY